MRKIGFFAALICQSMASFDMWTVRDGLPTSAENCDEIFTELNFLICDNFDECNIRSCNVQ